MSGVKIFGHSSNIEICNILGRRHVNEMKIYSNVFGINASSSFPSSGRLLGFNALY